MGVSSSCFYAWRKRPAKIISADELQLYRRAKALFESSRSSLRSRTLSKKLREDVFQVGRYHTRTIMRKLGLKVQQRVADKVTTKRKDSDRVADNPLNQNFNPLSEDEAWAGDNTYLRTHEGWMYLAIVMDLYSRRIVGWHIDKRMTSDLIGRALMMAIKLRQPRAGLVFHSDRGSQYTGKLYQSLLASFAIRPTMGDVGACWDNAVVERFFRSLKHDWILKVTQPTREHMKLHVAHYIRYYNTDRSHTANGDLSPVKYELSQLKVSGIG
jgi:putative transposase